MIRHALEKAQAVLVVTHVDPDGDACGSLSAVGLALKQIKQRATLVCDDNVPERFSYLPLAETIRQSPDPHTNYDLLIAVDCADIDRLGNAFAGLSKPKPFIINIDHHVTNTRFGDINVIEPRATSTAELLYALFAEWEIVVTPEIALSLLTGLVTDTMGFSTVGVTADTLRIAASLVESGADLGFVTMHALNLRAYSTLELWQLGLDKMSLEEGLLWTSITNQERRAVNFRSNSSVGLVNLFADTEEAAMAAVLMEIDDGSIKVGFRCRPPYDVSVVAMALGGGGHPLASGCTLPGPLDEAEALVVRACKEAIARQKPLVTAAESG